jgi:Phosphatidylglycerophosphate synthase
MSRVRYLAAAPPLVLGSVALIVAPPALAGSLLVAGVLSAELLVSLRRHPTPTRVGIANLLTLLRGLLIGALVLYIIGGPLQLPAVGAVLLYGTASALDAVDGFVARHRAETTAVGADLDQAVDSLGFVLAPLAAIALGALPVYYLALSAARYVYLAAVRLRGPAGLLWHRCRPRGCGARWRRCRCCSSPSRWPHRCPRRSPSHWPRWRWRRRCSSSRGTTSSSRGTCGRGSDGTGVHRQPRGLRSSVRRRSWFHCMWAWWMVTRTDSASVSTPSDWSVSRLRKDSSRTGYLAASHPQPASSSRSASTSIISHRSPEADRASSVSGVYVYGSSGLART